MKYIFRGNIILIYNPAIRRVIKVPLDKDGTRTTYFEQCKFIPEDYELLAKYFQRIANYEQGIIKEEFLKDIEVN